VQTVLTGSYESNILGLLASFGRPFFFELILYYYMHKLLPSRLNRYTLIALAFIYSVWYNLRKTELYATNYHLWMNVFINVFTFSILLFMFQGKFWRKFIIYKYFEIIHLMCETMAFVPFFLYYDSLGYRNKWSELTNVIKSDDILSLIYMIAIVVLFLILGFLSSRIWRRLSMQKFHPFYLLFIALLTGQMYSLSNVVHPGMGDWYFGIACMFVADVELAYRILAVFGVAVSLISSVALFFCILFYDKRISVEKRLQESRRVMKLAQARYEDIESQSEELTKIRHDFNNQLASITQLIRFGEEGAARELLDSLGAEIDNTEQNREFHD
jgi:hypothetical protein